MTPQDQEFFKDPEKKIFGDCARAVIASLLDLPIAEVPHFLQLAEDNPEGGGFYFRIDDWLEARGLEMLWHVNPLFHLKPGKAVYHYISGPSPRGNGIYHAVVGLNTTIAHDPHPSRAGLLEPHRWTYSFLVSVGNNKRRVYD